MTDRDKSSPTGPLPRDHRDRLILHPNIDHYQELANKLQTTRAEIKKAVLKACYDSHYKEIAELAIRQFKGEDVTSALEAAIRSWIDLNGE